MKQSPSQSSLDSPSPSEVFTTSEVFTPIKPVVSEELRRSSDSTVFSFGRARRRTGIMDKLENGVQSIFRRFSRSHTTITQLEIHILSTITHMSRTEILQWHDRFIAECPQGYMTKKKFVAMYKTLAPKGDVEDFARNLFRAFDLDKSNTIDFREFLIGISMNSPTTSPQMKLEWLFQVFDVDGNGTLTQDECLDVIETIVRFNQSQNRDQNKYDIEHLIISAKQSMMEIFDTASIDDSNTLTMVQFVEGCKKSAVISQLLTPGSS